MSARCILLHRRWPSFDADDDTSLLAIHSPTIIISFPVIIELYCKYIIYVHISQEEHNAAGKIPHADT